MNGWKMTSGSHVSSIDTPPSVPAARIRIFSELFKCHLTGSIALSAVFGQMIAAGFFSRETLVAGSGVWLLAAGAAVLNNIQDRDHDRRFVRTWNRCLPRKTIPVRTAAVLALILTGAGLTVLFGYPDTLWPGLLGLLALLCYNGLYTPMKKRTYAAVWPGVVCGMLPPAIGWTLVPARAAAGTGQDLLMLMLVLGLWQMPHFLALRADGPRFRPRETSVFPCLARCWTQTELQVQVLIWVSLYSLAILLFLIRGGIHSGSLAMILGGMALVLPAGMAWLQYQNRNRAGMSRFFVVNLSLFVFMVLGVLDRAVTGFFPLQ